MRHTEIQNWTNLTTTRGSAYDPWAHAEQLGIEVVERPLRTAHGLWVPDKRTILIHSRLRASHRRSALAHELGHAHHHHRDDRPKHEKQADKFAAYHLVDPGELAGLYETCDDERAIVQELGITTRLFRAYVLHHHQVA